MWAVAVTALSLSWSSAELNQGSMCCRRQHQVGGGKKVTALRKKWWLLLTWTHNSQTPLFTLKTLCRPSGVGSLASTLFKSSCSAAKVSLYNPYMNLTKKNVRQQQHWNKLFSAFINVLENTFLCFGSNVSSSLFFSGVCVSEGREITLFTHTFSRSKLSFSLRIGSRGLKQDWSKKTKHWTIIKKISKIKFHFSKVPVSSSNSVT